MRHGGPPGRRKVAAVVAAGGTGTRLRSPLPKQFHELGGERIICRTVDRLLELRDVIQVIVAVPRHYLGLTRALLKGKMRSAPVRVVPGGAERQESVHRAVLRVSPDANLILVHDAVRPLCDPEMMRRVLDAAWEKGAAVPGLPSIETVQRVSKRGWIRKTPPREELHAIQTPQCFRAAILRTSLDRAAREGYLGTDESSVVRWAGHRVAVVPGSPDNIKITRPGDLVTAEYLLDPVEGVKGRGMVRIGHGIDYHRLAKGRRLVIGGITIPFEKGLDGHSDADVLAHAVCDALLGAAAAGDIGQLFPDTDPRHRNRSSLDFLQLVREKLSSDGWRVRNVDATVLAQRPKLAPYFGEMKRRIARALHLPVEAVSVKATTTERMNAEGRGEGISAHAVALIERRPLGGEL